MNSADKNILKKSLVVVIVLIGVSTLAWALHNDGGRTDSSSNTPPPAQNSPTPKVEDTPALDIKSPASQYVLVNKTYGIQPVDYRPGDLVVPGVAVSSGDSTDEQSVREVIRPSLEKMVKGAKSAGQDLVMNSGFRSYKAQGFYFNNYVKQSGLDAAKKFSAEPGHSEHQTGLAFDLSYADKKCYLEICFGQTEAGKWLAEHAHEYGFILRYPDGKTDITGYQYEPWHFRYVGKDIAKEIFEKNLTYEEYLQSKGLI